MSSRTARFHEQVWVGVLLSPLRTVAVAAIAGVALLLCAWAIHGISVKLKGAEGIDGLKAVIRQDLEHQATIAAAQGLPAAWMNRLVNAPYALLFEWSGIHAMGRRFAEGDPLSVPDTVVRGFYLRHHREIEVAMLVTQLLGVRLTLILHAVPLVLLLYLLGAIDGLHAREVRRVTRSQESASLYHRAKYLQVWALAMTIVALLLWPFAMDIRYVGIPLAGAMGLLSRWQWSLYKKYL